MYNNNLLLQKINIPDFTDLDHMIEYWHHKYGFSKKEIKAALKQLKKHGVINYYYR